MINRNNYEEKFLDYFEGNLSDREVEELMRFLSENKDIEDEFYLLVEQSTSELFSEDSLVDITIKREAKIGYELSTFDYLCVAELENDITEDEKKVLNAQILVNNKLANEHLIYPYTKVPVEEIVYPHKDTLKKNVFKDRSYKRVISYSGIAAAVFIVFYLAYNGHENAPLVSDSSVLTGTAKNTSVKIDSIKDVDKVQVKTKKLSSSKASAIHIAQVSNGKKQTKAGNVSDSSAVRAVVKEVQYAYIENRSEAIRVENASPQLSHAMLLSDSGSNVDDSKISSGINEFLDKAKDEKSAVVETINEAKGRKKGVLIGKLIAGLNSLIGTDMQYSSKYTADGKLVAVDFQTKYINYSKKYDSEK